MVFIAPFVGAVALLSGFATALPRPDSNINDPAVSAPNGTPITASYYPSETAASDSSSGSDYGSSMNSYGSSSDASYGSSGYGSSDSSSYGSSDSPSSSDSSSYGSSYSPSSSDSYGSSDSSSSNYGSSGSYGSGSSYSSASYGNSYNTMTDLATSTSTSSAWMSYSTPSYGSGTSSWGNSGNSNSGYNDCVQQCVASYGALSATGTYTPSPTQESSDSSSGSGVTHTVIVAPTQGVLRYVPFVVNASVGDTVQFMWGANEHTVTKSSELTPCNKTSDALFESGEQNKGFSFTQVVNDTNPTFFYCGTPTHCQKGMFGIINPPNALGSPMSVSGMMQSIAANDSDTAAYVTYTASQTSSNADAAKWGGNIDLTSLPEWSHPLVVQNVLYARNFIAANAETLQDDGSIDLSAAGSTPLMIPQDLSAVLAASSATPAASTAAPAAATPAAAAPSPAGSAPAANAESAKSGAMSVSSPKVVVGLVAAFATFLML